MGQIPQDGKLGKNVVLVFKKKGTKKSLCVSTRPSSRWNLSLKLKIVLCKYLCTIFLDEIFQFNFNLSLFLLDEDRLNLNLIDHKEVAGYLTD